MSMKNVIKNFSVLIFTSFYGLGISTVSALSVSFAAKRMNVAGYYTWVFFFAKESFFDSYFFDSNFLDVFGNFQGLPTYAFSTHKFKS